MLTSEVGREFKATVGEYSSAARERSSYRGGSKRFTPAVTCARCRIESVKES
jgi:hypothetical protein